MRGVEERMRPLIAGNRNATSITARAMPWWQRRRTPTAGEITEMHAHFRQCVMARLGAGGRLVRILYGGSVTASNARDILSLPEGGGALVGGARLKAADFEGIIRAVPVTEQR
jgi:triosephosphate isomerase